MKKMNSLLARGLPQIDLLVSGKVTLDRGLGLDLDHSLFDLHEGLAFVLGDGIESSLGEDDAVLGPNREFR